MREFFRGWRRKVGGVVVGVTLWIMGMRGNVVLADPIESGKWINMRPMPYLTVASETNIGAYLDRQSDSLVLVEIPSQRKLTSLTFADLGSKPVSFLNGIALAGNAKRVAAVFENRLLAVWTQAGQFYTRRTLDLTPNDSYRTLAFSPTGTVLGIAGSRTALIVELDGMQSKHLCSDLRGPTNRVAFHNGLMGLSADHSTESVRLFDVEAQTPIPTLQNLGWRVVNAKGERTPENRDRFCDLLFGSRGKVYAGVFSQRTAGLEAGEVGRIRVWDTKTRAELPSIELPGISPQSLSPASKESIVFVLGNVARNESVIAIVDTEASQVLQMVKVPGDPGIGGYRDLRLCDTQKLVIIESLERILVHDAQALITDAK